MTQNLGVLFRSVKRGVKITIPQARNLVRRCIDVWDQWKRRRGKLLGNVERRKQMSPNCFSAFDLSVVIFGVF